MDRLRLASMLVVASFSAHSASADIQNQIDSLQARIQTLKSDAVRGARTFSLRGPHGYKIGSDIYNEVVYMHDFGLNKDLSLLNERYESYKHANPDEKIPRVLVSALLESRLGRHSTKFGIENPDHESFIRSKAELSFTASASEDWLGYFEVRGDGRGTTTRRAVDNAKVNVYQLFLTYGNFEKSPVYATLGYQYLPFGSFTTRQITDTLPRDLARTKAPAALGGYDYRDETVDLNAALFVFDGDTKDARDFSLNQWGLNLQGRKTGLGAKRDMKISAGVSYINNMASSEGISDEVVDSAASGGANLSKLKHYIPAVDVRSKWVKGPWSVWGEYITATRSFAQRDFAQTHAGHAPHGIQPEALHAEANYQFELWNFSQTLAISYDATRDALAFGLPKSQIVLGYVIKPIRNLQITSEYAHKNDYGKNESADLGNGTNTVAGTGKTDDLFQIALTLYF